MTPCYSALKVHLGLPVIYHIQSDSKRFRMVLQAWPDLLRVSSLWNQAGASDHPLHMFQLQLIGSARDQPSVEGAKSLLEDQELEAPQERESKNPHKQGDLVKKHYQPSSGPVNKTIISSSIALQTKSTRTRSSLNHFQLNLIPPYLGKQSQSSIGIARLKKKSQC